MSRLANLLGEPERKMRKVIAKLEDLSGYNSEDVRLMAQMQAELNAKIGSLGLDPSDTTGEELHEALKAKLAKDLSHLSRAWNLNDSADGHKITQVLESVSSKDEVLAIKCAAAKRLLKSLPPKKTVKLLGYRSLDSLLKREDTRYVLAEALQNESAQWNSKFAHKVRGLKASDYEFREVKFLISSSIFQPTSVPLMATVSLPASSSMPAAEVLRALEAEAELLSASKYLSINQFAKDFGRFAERIFSGHSLVAIEVGGESFLTPRDQVQNIAPHLPHINFAGLHPALAWWKNTGHLAAIDRTPVSLHIGDCLENILNQRTYESRSVLHFSAEFKRQLLDKYSKYETVKNYISGSIDDTFITLNSISARQLAPEFEETYK